MNCARLMSTMPSWNGGLSRVPSMRVADSTCTTVAPWSASPLLISGPTPNHAKSATLMPSKARPRAPYCRAAGSSGSRGCRSRPLASPGSGGGACGPREVRESFANGPG